jgi:hypothetical protein
MLLPEKNELEVELLKRQIETHKFVNGLLALTYIGLAAYAVYKLVGVFL